MKKFMIRFFILFIFLINTFGHDAKYYIIWNILRRKVWRLAKKFDNWQLTFVVCICSSFDVKNKWLRARWMCHWLLACGLIHLPFLMFKPFAVSVIDIVFVKACTLTITKQTLTIQITLLKWINGILSIKVFLQRIEKSSNIN